MTTPEARYITTPEQVEYWGGFFGEALRPRIDRAIRQPRPTARNPMTRVYYGPRLQVFERRRDRLDYIERNFGGAVRQQSTTNRAQDILGFSAEPGFFWILEATTPMLSLLEEVQSYMIAQSESVRVMIDFLSAKQNRLEEYRGLPHDRLRELAERRMEEEAEFYRQFREAQNSRHQLRLPLTPANIAGVLDISGSLSITRDERKTRRGIYYGASVNVHSDNTALLETLADLYNGSIFPIRYGTPPVYSERRFYCDIRRDEEIKKLLETTLPYLNLQRRQAEIALKFINLQQELTVGSETTGWRGRRGDLVQSLQRHSTSSIKLVTMLREGFYSEMYRLNNEK